MTMDFNAWAARADTKKLYLVETSARRLADGALLPLYLGSHGLTLEDRHYLPCKLDLPRLTRQANDTLTANHIPTYGELTVRLEPNYRPDAYNSVSWRELLSSAYNLRGQPLVIKLGGEGWAYDDFRTVFAGRIDKPSWTDAQLTLPLYDKGRDLEQKFPDYELPESPYVAEESWDQPPPLVLGAVKNYKPVLIKWTGEGYYGWRFALACHVMQGVDAVYGNNVLLATPADYLFVPQDLFPARKDGEGSAVMVTSGPYAGALVRAEWLVRICSVTTPNEDGALGPEVGLAWFQWSLDNGETWSAPLLTWLLAYDPTTFAKPVSIGAGALIVSGTYSSQVKKQFRAKISSGGYFGTPAKFRLSTDGGLNYGDEIEIANADPIDLGHGLSAIFTDTRQAGPVTKTPGVPETPSPGSMTANGAANTLGAPADFEAVITVSGDVGVAKFKWRKNGGSWSTEIFTSAMPITLSDGVTVAFVTEDPPSGDDDFDVDDTFDFTAYPAFVVDDYWSWTVKEIPVPLADGVAVQFTGGAGADFVLWDNWRFILGSSLLMSLAVGVNVTVDARGLVAPDLGYSHLIGNLIRALIQVFAGWTAADFDLEALAAFNLAFPYQAGRVVDSPTEIARSIDDLLSGLPALYTINQDDKFQLFELQRPAGMPVMELTDVEFLESPEGADGDDHLYRRVYLHYDRNPNAEKDPQGSPAQERLEWLRREYRQISERDDTVLENYPWAGDLGPLATCLRLRPEAQALALKLLNLFKIKGETAKIRTKNQPFCRNLGQEILVRRSRFGDQVGLVFIILGMELNLTDNSAILSLWR